MKRREYKLLFTGTMGAGKTTAIAAISEFDPTPTCGGRRALRGLMPYPCAETQDLLTSARSSKTHCEPPPHHHGQRMRESTMTSETPRDEVTSNDSGEQNQDADDAYDPVDEAGWESFPASDPPAWSVASSRKER